jgi:hypothetical protein
MSSGIARVIDPGDEKQLGGGAVRGDEVHGELVLAGREQWPAGRHVLADEDQALGLERGA